MFPSRVSTPLQAQPTPEDIFESSLSSLFTDDAQNSHGVPGASVTYHSPRFGNITLRIPAHPDVEEGRRLFAHYLWNAGVICADAIEESSREWSAEERRKVEAADAERAGVYEGERVPWDARHWDMRSRKVLELGAGTALPSIVSALSGASHTVITDHPSSPALTTRAIEANVKENILKRRTSGSNDAGATECNVEIFGYTWGTSTMYLQDTYGKPAPTQPANFDRIIIADCLWMPSQHGNLVRTILQYLRPESQGEEDVSSKDQPCALVIAGFHTGRDIVANFFSVATQASVVSERGKSGTPQEEDDEDRDVRGKLRAAEIFEIDVNGKRRDWQSIREGETKQDAKRWCVCAALVRR